jgi:copper chaperone
MIGDTMEKPGLIKLVVTGMTCQGCVNAVTRVVKRTDPDARVSIDLTSGQLEAETVASQAGLLEAIQHAGYGAKPA